ncbi:hypothetical protein HQ393_09985 [Chitinibacter bivalviorum]|uniref:Chromosome partitioning protein ParB n=2 Tax=Chitinibacter bivalviorum TaxID=2739434 RepID=A0A7H9BPA8_9NEIS|nr:hypothetical protein HQ393_09985 [Chitinibacter bivalviorum]
MRKQYHLRPCSEGLKAWDVHRLIALSTDLPWLRLPLSQIAELDQNYWFDQDEPTGRAIAEHVKLIAACDLRYPIILSQDGRVMDGMHRVLKAYIQGFEYIDAVQFLQDPAPDFIGVAAQDLPY